MTNYNIRANKTDRASPGAACSTSSRRLRSRVRTELTDCGSSGLEFIRICASRMASRNRTGSVLEGPSNGFRRSCPSCSFRSGSIIRQLWISLAQVGRYSPFERFDITRHTHDRKNHPAGHAYLSLQVHLEFFFIWIDFGRIFSGNTGRKKDSFV